jgi:hypothetical protein
LRSHRLGLQFKKQTEGRDLVDLSETVIVTAANWFATSAEYR